MSLEYHPYPRHRVPFDPNLSMDDARLAREAQAKGKTVAAYVAERLAYRWPDGSPAYTEAGAQAPRVADTPAAGPPAGTLVPTPAAVSPPRKKL